LSRVLKRKRKKINYNFSTFLRPTPEAYSDYSSRVLPRKRKKINSKILHIPEPD
jgi:hypothetical protein